LGSTPDDRSSAWGKEPYPRADLPRGTITESSSSSLTGAYLMPQFFYDGDYFG